MSVVWQGRYLEALQSDGWEWGRRPGGMTAAVILPITDAGEVVLVEEHRVPFGRAVIALPAGLVGDGPGDDSPEAAAVRELAEEAGYIARHWRSVGEFATSPGMSSETYHFYIATGLERIGQGGGVAGEDITVHLVPLRQVGAFTAAARARGAMIDAKLLALLAFAEGA